MERFESIPKAEERQVAEEELRDLLIRLHRVELVEAIEESDCHTTVDDIAEALDTTPTHVYKELLMLREERRRKQIEAALTEMEEPLYRVERPSTGPTTTRLDYGFKKMSVETILDKLHFDKASKAIRASRLKRQEKSAHTQSVVVLTLLAVALIVILLFATGHLALR